MKTIAAAVLAASVFTFAVHAQSSLAETIEVRITNVDVVVTDKAGNPVTGLTKDDFEVVEGKKPQTITNFYEIRDAAAVPAPGAESSEAAPQVPPEMSRRRIILFVDNFTIHPIARNQALKAVENSLDTLLRPGDEAMVVLWQGGGTDQALGPFTSDKAKLISQFREQARRSGGGMVLEGMRSQLIEHATQMINDSLSPTETARQIPVTEAYKISSEGARSLAEMLYSIQKDLMAGLDQTLNTLAGVPGKKALIFIGAELAEDPGLDIIQKIDSIYQRHVSDIRPAVAREAGRTLRPELRKVAERANANGVTMYLVDAGDRSRHTDPTQHMLDPEASFISDTNTPLAMGTIASITGGLAVSGGKSFEQALGTVARDLSSYYSLGYRSPEGGEDRKVTVRVKKPGLRVRSRTSYTSRKGDQDIRDRVIANVFHDSVKSDFPISVTAGSPEAVDGGLYRVKLTITLPTSITLIPKDDSLQGEFAVFFATGKPGGALSEVSKAVQKMKFPADAGEVLDEQETFEFPTTLVVAPGEQFISVGVTDTLAGTSGFARTKVIAQ